MNHIRIFVLFILIILQTQCTSKQKSLEKSVIALHDHLMILHDSTMTQHSISGNLAEKLKIKGLQKDSTLLTAIDSIRTELDGSNEYMMDWMNNYHEPELKDSAALKYLNQQILLLQELALHQKKNINQAYLLLNQSIK